MGFPFTVLYIGLTMISVGETLPFLAPFRVMILLALVGGLASLPAVLTNQAMMQLPQFPLMLAFIGILPFSRLAQGWLGGVPDAFMTFMPVAMSFFFLIFNATSARHIKIILATITSMSILMVTLSLNQYFGVQGDLVMQQTLINQETWEVTILPRIRFRGFLGDPNDFAQFLLTLLPFFFVFYKKRSFFKNLFICYAPCAFILTGIFYTRSRGALMGIATIVLFFLKDKIGAAAGAAMSGVLVFTLLIVGFAGGRALSVGGGMDRLDIWSDGIGMFKMSPIWGVGYGGFTEYSKLTAHNSYVLAMSELGIVGLFIWMSMIVASFLQLRWVRKTTENVPELSDYARLAKLTQFSFYAFLVTAYFLSRTYTVTIYILFGISMVLYLRVYQFVMYSHAAASMPAQAVNPGKFSHPVPATTAIEPIAYEPIRNWVKPGIYATIGIALSTYIAVRMRIF